ncbi:phytase [Pseudothauera rhizosphaerae]|uniref:Phytase n=1 Tax=Pseudothauera rhizosphaerae TaxID=2565932 RepID=A0A4S4B051_9RHOO|nr:phytase [Pseudothauera rhizosphaerae]THF65379.1 phytase [Pseudothauera rhizosphaerae]
MKGPHPCPLLPFPRRLGALACALALAGCAERANHDAPAADAAPALQTTPWTPAVQDVEAAQWLAGAAPGEPRQRLLASEREGLQWLDASGRSLARLDGRYEGLDHRAGADGVLVASIDAVRQQAVVAALDMGARRWGEVLYLPRRNFKIDGLCLYRDEAGNLFAFLVGEEGKGEQWLVGQGGAPLAQARQVRSLGLPPAATLCHADDGAGLLYVNEEGVGLWAYPAHAEAPLERQPVDLRAPFGGVQGSVAGVAAVPGGVLALDPEAGRLHRYRFDGEDWQAETPLALPGLSEPEWLAARVDGTATELLIGDDQGWHEARIDWRPAPPPAPRALPVLPARVQTDPVPSLGDAADDPAIWLHPDDPRRSLVLGTDKQGGLVVYDLHGRTVQDLRVGRQNNVDVRAGFRVGDRLMDLAVSTNRDHNSLHVFAIERDSGRLTVLGEIDTPLTDIYGLCLFKDAQGDIHAFANDKDGSFVQYRLSAPDGRPQGELVRRFAVASQPEGCVADDRRERLFVGEEDVAVWALDARADAPAAPEQVIAVGDVVQDDIEGLALYHGKSRDYLVISSQGNDSYVVLDATPPYALRGAFRIGLNAGAGIDGASETDGLEVTSANLGGLWSEGLLVVQDGRKRMPEGPQNYKYLPWADVVRALGLEP